jgi:hypothetical protein
MGRCKICTTQACGGSECQGSHGHLCMGWSPPSSMTLASSCVVKLATRFGTPCFPPLQSQHKHTVPQCRSACTNGAHDAAGCGASLLRDPLRRTKQRRWTRWGFVVVVGAGGGGGGVRIKARTRLARSPCEPGVRSLANDLVRAMSDIPASIARIPTLRLLGSGACAASPLLAAGAAESPSPAVVISADGGSARVYIHLGDPTRGRRLLWTTRRIQGSTLMACRAPLGIVLRSPSMHGWLSETNCGALLAEYDPSSRSPNPDALAVQQELGATWRNC